MVKSKRMWKSTQWHLKGLIKHFVCKCFDMTIENPLIRLQANILGIVSSSPVAYYKKNIQSLQEYYTAYM